VVEWLESLPTIERISATCDAENRRSARVLEKLGLTLQGILAGGMLRPNISDQPRETHVYARKRTAV
jgi:RimJ/RimL family protein N-acetyltransferase